MFVFSYKEIGLVAVPKQEVMLIYSVNDEQQPYLFHVGCESISRGGSAAKTYSAAWLQMMLRHHVSALNTLSAIGQICQLVSRLA